MSSIKLAFVEIECTIQNARHFFISKLCYVLTIPACPSAKGLLLPSSKRTIIMELAIHGLLTGSMAIYFFKFNQVSKKFKHCFVSRV